MRSLGRLGGSSSYVFGVNNAGQAVGVSNTPQGLTHAFITGPNGVGMRDLGTLGVDHSIAYGISDSGQVVGVSLSPENAQVFITGPNGTGMRILDTAGRSATPFRYQRYRAGGRLRRHV
jgi:probable HAF family extracellular repeat protein